MAQFDVRPVTSPDYRRLAQKRLPRFLFEYVDGAANEETTRVANQADLRRLELRQQVMRDVSRIDTSTELLGRQCAIPLATAPVGLAGMMARRAEVQGIRATERAGIPFTLSTMGIASLEEIAAASPNPCWFQLYMLKDRGLVQSLLQRAQSHGVSTLVFTVDLAVTGMRHRDVRNGMVGKGFRPWRARMAALLTRPHWVWNVGLRGKPHDFGNLRGIIDDATDLDAYKKFISAQFDRSVTWADIAWLRTVWDGKIVIKGVLTGNDAVAAADAGADGVVVSNHGGRQLDGVASTISKLPEVVAAVGDRIEVLMDGGVRNGLDVVRAVALGARGVLIGRPWIWAVAARGEQGLVDLLTVFQREIEVAMALMGVNRINELTPDMIQLPG